jgi:DNA repair exonuclease SbcCD ATPase subunit
MKNIPSFKQFKDNYSLLESAGTALESMYADLKSDIGEIETPINEGVFGNALKNWASKKFLGPLGLSKISYVDKGRDALLGLELELLKRSDKHESELESYAQELESLSSEVPGDKPRIEAIDKKIKDEENVFNAYVKAQKLKIEKAKDIIEASIDGNERRRLYAEAGLAEDKIILAEKEYELAKRRSISNEDLNDLTDKIKKLRNDLEEKIKSFKDSEEEKVEKEEKITKMQQEIVSDPVAKQIIDKVKKVRVKGIIDLKEDIKKDIATLEADRDRIEEEMKKKRRSGKLTGEALKKYKSRISIVSAEIEGRKKQLELLEGLGNTSTKIRENLKDPKKSQETLDKLGEIDMKVETEKSEK